VRDFTVKLPGIKLKDPMFTAAGRLLGLALMAATALCTQAFCTPALADGHEAARAARIGFKSWSEGAAAGAEIDGRVRWAVAAPDPRAEGSRRGFNVRSAGSFPLWGWKPGRYQDLWSATGEFALRVEAPPGEYLLAAGREHRDWSTLAAAARGLDVEIRVAGPAAVEPPLRALGSLPRERFLELLRDARALVVPLARDDVTAGQLAVLDAFSVGRPVVATRAQGTEDYVADELGLLVPPRDPEALRAGLARMAAPGVAEAMGAAALAAARGPLSLTRFVRDVAALA
jgi:glycosyltransferase involved in cell wall biosynthesis